MKYIITIFLTVFAFSVQAQRNHEVLPTSEFKVAGLVEHQVTFQIRDLMSARQVDLGDVIIRNHKGEEKSRAKGVKGILLKTFVDSAGVHVDKPKEYGELYIVLSASDGYKNVYSWSELFNSEIGNHVYIITAMDGKNMDQMPDRILVISVGDYNSGLRHLKGLAKIEVKKVE